MEPKYEIEYVDRNGNAKTIEVNEFFVLERTAAGCGMQFLGRVIGHRHENNDPTKPEKPVRELIGEEYGITEFWVTGRREEEKKD